MRIVELLVDVSARDKEVEGRLKGLLGIVEDRVEAIPACGPQGTRGVHKTGEGHWYHLIGGVL